MGSQTCSVKQRKGSSLALKIAKCSESSIKRGRLEEDQSRTDKKDDDQEERRQCQKGRFDESRKEKT
jgi:hypothetical protein